MQFLWFPQADTFMLLQRLSSHKHKKARGHDVHKVDLNIFLFCRQLFGFVCRRDNLKEISNCKVVLRESVARQPRMGLEEDSAGEKDEEEQSSGRGNQKRKSALGES